MSNVIEFPVRSNVKIVSDLELGHEVARYCLEVMLDRGEISQEEFDIATIFVDTSFIFDQYT